MNEPATGEPTTGEPAADALVAGDPSAEDALDVLGRYQVLAKGMPDDCRVIFELHDEGDCLPAAPGFAECIYHAGDVDCPGIDSPYVDKYVFYGSVDDTQSCSPCTCGAPAGGSCSVLISVYSDTCTTLLDATTITATSPLCLDVPTGSALGSKAATPATYTPGTCQPSGGESMGTAMESAPSTFCCLVQ